MSLSAAARSSASASIIPQGVGAPLPQGLDPKKGKLMCIKVRMLDDTVGVFHLGHRAYGQALFEEVCRHLNLLESDYFGLELCDSDGAGDGRFYFVVKFYTPNPEDLEEEYTRYLFALQIKRDLSTGSLHCTDNTAALLASYIVQAECGDYASEDYPDHSYLSATKFVPNQDAEFEKLVMRNHQKHVGLSPAEADMSLLETARRCETYGVKFHHAKLYRDGVPVNLSVTHSGISEFHGFQCVNKFSWAKIRKLDFKRRRFFIKLHEDNGYDKDMAGFIFNTRNECKMFWKKCIENHTFFRCMDVPKTPTQQFQFFSKGSKFRFSGRTQKQLIDYVRDHHKRREPFQRPLTSTTLQLLGDSSCDPRSTSVERTVPIPILPITFINNNNCVKANGDAFRNGSFSPESTIHIAPSTTISVSQPDHQQFSPPFHSEQSNSERSNLPSYSNQQTASMNRKVQQQLQEYDVFDNNNDYGSSKVLSTFSSVPKYNHSTSELQNSVPFTSPQSSRYRSNRLESMDNSSGQFVVGSGGSTPHLQTQLSSFTGGCSIPSSPHPPTPMMGLSGYRDRNPSSIVHQWSTDRASLSERDIPKAASDDEALVRRKKPIADRSYFISKELLMTERTFGRDLTVLCNNFKNHFAQYDHLQLLSVQGLLQNLFSALEPISTAQLQFLSDLEQCLATWEARTLHPSSPLPPCKSAFDSQQQIGSIILCFLHNSIQVFYQYLSMLPSFLVQLAELCRSKPEVKSLLDDFENEDHCYLPVYYLLLKPYHRLLQYQVILTRLVAHYFGAEATLSALSSSVSGSSTDNSECRIALEKVTSFLNGMRDTVLSLEDCVKLAQLERDVCDVNNLFQPNRVFIREGALLRYSRKGALQRMFFLFNDCILYGNRVFGSAQFRIHGQIPLRGLLLEDGAPKNIASGLLHSFTIYGGNHSLIVAASTIESKQHWIEDISRSVMAAKETVADVQKFATLKSYSSVSEVDCGTTAIGVNGGTQMSALSVNKSSSAISNNCNSALECGNLSSSALKNQQTSSEHSPCGTGERQMHYKANNTTHVCWYRLASISATDLYNSGKNVLSGYLLRKFRNSSGWQKLWVVFSHFSLFFYKSHQDAVPLASLPLLGYGIASPEPADGISKEYVFKLHYKAHFYFFRADSEYSYIRWLEALRTICMFAVTEIA